MASETNSLDNGGPHLDSSTRFPKESVGDPIAAEEGSVNPLSAFPLAASSSSISSISKAFGPLSKEQAEQLQLEANEETTRSEDLRLFLQEMREHVSQQNQQQQQQQQHTAGGGLGGGGGCPVPALPAQLIGGSQVSFGSQLEAKQQHGIHPQVSNRSSALGAGGHPQGMNTSAAATNVVTFTGAKRSITADPPDYAVDSAPDGGWGWLVVFGSFCCMIMVDGISLCYGLLVAPTCPGQSLQALNSASLRRPHPSTPPSYDLGIVWSIKAREKPLALGSCLGHSEMGESFHTQSRALLMTPGGFLVGIYLLFGPLSSALSNQFDFRPVAMAGGIISTIGFLGAAFSKNVETLTVTLGIIGGIGFGLVYLPAIATVGHWFKRRRPFAVGLALCGSGVGTIIGGQVIPLFICWFTWRGTMIIFASICAQCLAVIVLFRPLELHLRIKQARKVRRQQRRACSQLEAAMDLGRLREERDRRRLAKLEQEQAVRAHTAASSNATRSNTAHSRAAKKAMKAQKAQQRRVIYRGSIMQRIIEEKHRQRTVSLGSLDGMVITRDNELIAAALVADRPVLLTAASITRISEAVMRKMEVRLAGTGLASQTQQTLVNNAAAAPLDAPKTRFYSDVTAPPIDVLLNQMDQQMNRVSSLSRRSSTARTSGIGSKMGLSRSNMVRESLPQLVQNYVQSQASLAVQNYMAKQATSMAVDTLGSAGVSGSSITANKRALSTHFGPITPQAHRARALSSLLQGRDLTVCTVGGVGGATDSSPAGSANTNNNIVSDAYAVELEDEHDPETMIPTLLCTTPGSCPSESVSFRRATSDSSLASSLTGRAVTTAENPATLGDGSQKDQITLKIQLEVAQLLDGEVRSEVRQRLRRELLRPQYKKDLFFTGSVHQLNSSPVPVLPLADEPGSIWVKPSQSHWGFESQPGLTGTALFTPSAPINGGVLSSAARIPSALVNTHKFCDNNSLSAVAMAPAAAGPTELISTNISSSVNPDPQPPVRLATLDYEFAGDEVAGIRNSPAQPAPTDIKEDEDLIEKSPFSCSNPICAFLEELLAPGLLLSPTFIFMLLSNVLTMFGLIIPYFMFPDLAAEMNWTPLENGSIISYIGFANTIGRCIATLYIEKAWSSHYKWADCLRVNVASLILSGAAVAMVPILRFSYNFVIGAGSVFGLFSAVVVSLKSILVVELFGLDRLTNAFGHMLLVQGISCIAAAPLGGYLWDVFAARADFTFHPWSSAKASPVRVADTAFYFSALSLFGAALLASPMRCLQKRETIRATYNNTLGGGVYVDDDFDGDCAAAPTGQQSEMDGVSLPGGAPPPSHTSTGHQSPQQLQATGTGGQANQLQQQQQQLLPFDSGISSCDAAASQLPGYPGIMPNSILSGDTAASCTLVPSLQPPPPQAASLLSDATSQQPSVQLVPPPLILSPAPLPSGLFLTDTTIGGGGGCGSSDHAGGEDGLDSGGGGGPTGGDDDNLVTVAGVPLMVPGAPPALVSAPPPTLPPPEVKSLVDEPALEPVIEEEEEDIKAEEAGIALPLNVSGNTQGFSLPPSPQPEKKDSSDMDV